MLRRYAPFFLFLVLALPACSDSDDLAFAQEPADLLTRVGWACGRAGVRSRDPPATSPYAGKTGGSASVMALIAPARTTRRPL